MSKPDSVNEIPSVETIPVSFYSKGMKLVGELFMPDQIEEGASERVPGVVVGVGWGGTRHSSVRHASRLRAAGFAVLTFDFRGYGDSEGEHNHLYPLDQVADMRAGVAYLRGRPEIDPERVAVFGVLVSASAGLQAASEDSGIRAAVGFFAIGSGERWLREVRKHWEWLELVKQVEADRIERSMSGSGTTLIDPSELMIRDPEAAAKEERSRAAKKSRKDWKLGLDSADAIMSWKPEDHVHRISPRAVMLVAVENDGLVPFDETKRLYAKLAEPKRMLTVHGISHHAVYHPENLDGVITDVAAFLHESMTPSNEKTLTLGNADDNSPSDRNAQ